MGVTRVRGYEIVCPDGSMRHYPYHHLGDATCDADVWSEGDGRCVCDDEFTVSLGSCPGGAHTVRPASFDVPDGDPKQRLS